MRGWCSWNHDPGPCPVDDTPHTACTPSAVGSLTVAVRRPRILDRAPLPQAVTTASSDETFTTKTYTRAVHGRAAVVRRAKQRGTGH